MTFVRQWLAALLTLPVPVRLPVRRDRGSLAGAKTSGVLGE